MSWRSLSRPVSSLLWIKSNGSGNSVPSPRGVARPLVTARHRIEPDVTVVGRPTKAMSDHGQPVQHDNPMVSSQVLDEMVRFYFIASTHSFTWVAIYQ